MSEKENDKVIAVLFAAFFICGTLFGIALMSPDNTTPQEQDTESYLWQNAFEKDCFIAPERFNRSEQIAVNCEHFMDGVVDNFEDWCKRNGFDYDSGYSKQYCYLEESPQLEQDFSCPNCICNYEPQWKLVQACHLPEKYFKLNQQSIELTGYSMQPAIFTGNKLRMVKFKEWMLKDIEGCPVLFEIEGTRIIHLVKGVYYNHIITQGMNNSFSERVEFEEIKLVGIGIEYV